MGVAYFLRADEYSELSNNAPSRDDITAALRVVADRTHDWPRAGGTTNRRVIGAWVGPGPRVTRVVDPIATGNVFKTRVAWIYGISDEEERNLPTPEAKRAFADNLAQDISLTLNERAGLPNLIGAHWNVVISGYDPAENGSPDWWESGDASREATYVDTFPSLVRQRLPDDNPSGPNSVHRNPTPTDPMEWLKWAAWLTGGVAALVIAVEFGPAIASWVPTKSKPKAALANPRGRRR